MTNRQTASNVQHREEYRTQNSLPLLNKLLKSVLQTTTL